MILLALVSAAMVLTAPMQDPLLADPLSVDPALTQLLVSTVPTNEDAFSRLKARLGVISTDHTTAGLQVWTLPDHRVLDAFAELQTSRSIDAVDYAGDDYRTLFVEVPETYLNAAETLQLEAVRTWPGLAEVRLQRERRGGLSADILKRGFSRRDGLSADGAFLLDLPGGQRVLAEGLAIDAGSGEIEWRGALALDPGGQSGPQSGEAVLSAANNTIQGSLVIGDDLYLFSPIGERGLQSVARFKVNDLPPDHASHRSGGVVSGEGTTFIEMSAPPPETTIVSVGVLWTDGAEADAIRWSRNIDDAIDSMIRETNEGLRLSGATFRLRLTASRRIADQEGGDFRADAIALAGRSDGRWDNAHAWRDQTRSDIVLLVRSSVEDQCGEAVAINAGEAQAFAVVSYFCGIAKHSLSHEVGHLLGARHLRDTTTTTTPVYARGYLHGSEWRTIMVEDLVCNCGRINHWANPNVSYRGVPSGVANQNQDLRVMNSNAARIADYR